MKKTIVLAALGLTTSAVTSFGQGSVIFSSYSANNTTGAYTYLFGGTTPIPDGFHADLYQAIGSVVDSVNTASSASVTALPSGLSDVGVLGILYSGGFFNDANPVTVLTSGQITFEVVAFNGSTYANSTIRGRSGSFTMTSLAAAPSPLNGLGDNGQPFPTMFVSSVPEPTTLALAGLGGLASLVALRRKQA
jgi:hypothetical protein